VCRMARSVVVKHRAAGLAGIVVALLSGVVPARAQVQLSLPGQTVAPGGSVVLPVTWSSGNQSVTGIQFDLSYDSTAITLGATVGNGPRNSEKGLYFTDLAPGLRRFILVGLNQAPIPDGILLILFANVRSGARGGEYGLGFENVLATDVSGQQVTTSAGDGTLTVEGSAGSGPRLQTDGVLNGASFLPGPVSPGEIVTLIGSEIGPAYAQQPDGAATSAVLDGTSVIFDGTPAPLLYAASSQINVIAPFALYGKDTTQLQVLNGGGDVIAELTVPVVPASPALLTANSTGVGQGAILNQDSTANTPSNPADKGSTIMLFAIGGGQTDPPGVDGMLAVDLLPKPLLPVSVQIGGLDAPVAYEGAAPTFVAGVLQVNCVVPMDAPSGYAVPIVFTVGQATSPSGVTLAIR